MHPVIYILSSTTVFQNSQIDSFMWHAQRDSWKFCLDFYHVYLKETSI